MDVWKLCEYYVKENIRINLITSLNLDNDATNKKHRYEELHIIINRTLKRKEKEKTTIKYS